MSTHYICFWGEIRYPLLSGALIILLFSGTILLDANGIVIVYMNKTLPVQFMFDPSLGRSKNNTAFALQWGPLIGPNQFDVENRTVIPMVSH